MTLEAEEPKPFFSRQHTSGDDYWCLVYPNSDHRPEPGFHIDLKQGKIRIEFLTFYKLTREEHSELHTQCRSRRCQLVLLPATYTPKDLQVHGR